MSPLPGITLGQYIVYMLGTTTTTAKEPGGPLLRLYLLPTTYYLLLTTYYLLDYVSAPV